jgi:hypothetical protein
MSEVGMTGDGRRLQDEITETLRASRSAEADIIGTMPAEVRDGPGLDGGWSPKDIQAHLTGWKERQAERFAAARLGESVDGPLEDLDAINAELHAGRADWTWDQIADEAVQVTARLIAEIETTDLATLTGSPRLLGGSIGNGASHSMEHLARLARVTGTGDERVLSFAREIEAIIRASAFPDPDKATFIYNQACYHALAGRLDEARDLLPEAFSMRPDLVEWAQQDSDLAEIRDELAVLAAG